MDSEDGELFIKQLASFVRTHEKALANALQFRRQNTPRHGASQSVSSIPTNTLSVSAPSLSDRPSTSSSTSSALAAALSLGSLSFTSHTVKSAKLALTAHHLFYLLSRFEELAIPVGPMGIRIENIHDAAAATNYVSFLSQSQRSKSRGSDVGSIRSVSSLRSVMSGMSSFWASFGIGSSISAARTERQKAAIQADLKYLYSAFTKIPCLRLAPDWRAHLIKGYEEFPFDSAVPLYVFKNVQALEVCDMDFRQFYGWDRLADQLRSLTLKRACVDDPVEILVDIVLDDMDKRRRRTSKAQASPTVGPYNSSTGALGTSPRRSNPNLSHAQLHKSASMPASPDPRHSALDMRIGSVISEPPIPDDEQPRGKREHRPSLARSNSDDPNENSPSKSPSRPRSHSPRRPSSSRNNASYVRGSHKVRRSGSGSSQSSLSDSWHNHNRRGSSSNLLSVGVVPASKWRFLKHLSLADNSLTAIPAYSLSPLSNTLHSLDLSYNLFSQIPDSLATLTALRALNLSHCMIDSLHSLMRFPLPAITALNLRANRLQSIAGIEKLYPLERLDLRDNGLTDPMELARLSGIPEIREIWVSGNPFTRTHRDYRTTIFNIFRNTPGFTEDIIIDSAGPSYSEKKYLVERAPLPPIVPVIKTAPAPLIPAVDVGKSISKTMSKSVIVYDPVAPREPSVLRKERLSGRSSDGNAHAARRRRVPRRRIVDLATNESTTRLATVPISTEAILPLRPAEPLSDATLSSASEENYRISYHLPEAPVPATTVLPVLDKQSEPHSQSSEIPRTSAALQPQLASPPRNYSSVETQTPSGPEVASNALIVHTPIQTPTKTPSAVAHSPPPLHLTAALPSTAPVTGFPATGPRTPTETPTKTPAHQTSPGGVGPWKDPQDWDVSGEIYKRKIEALRDQVGDGYLSVLSEEAWDPVRHPSQYNDNPFSSTTTSPLHVSPTTTRTAGVQAIHAGRTLG